MKKLKKDKIPQDKAQMSRFMTKTKKNIKTIIRL